MLNHISWQQYITAISLLTAAWYVYVALRFRLFHFKPAAAGQVPPVVSAAVIGAIRPGEGEARSPEELIFGSSAPDDISDATLPKGPADDFLAEAQTLADAAGNKTDFLALLELLVSKYEPDEPDLNALFPRLNTPFTITPEEWPKI